ncbi:beta-ketoacyl-[acyl-carrier-protein] synthase family protein [Siminovitchia sp. FSL H7-0308]|uniref:3-oxoacyl-[acyl-carrier-protein] synthase II n=1 Tax=Siminovitchia thermophila TaxID=1245522 RepID=A0ABS2RBS1_9BACI|nr:beta-ketoacyl-[acyl-carrier-protein] synthase family protein [Siminovitchia thermophila]MBM7716604.1 3-oxoacyl-[acyl-carrier-protein] synthase II [Siminovitchia thermophila]
MKRIAITGIGVLSSIGNGKDDFLQGLLASRSGLSDVTSFDVTDYPIKKGAEILPIPLPESDAYEDEVVKKAFIAAEEALVDAGLNDCYAPQEIGVSVATSLGGINSRVKYYTERKNKGKSDPSLLLHVPTSNIAGSLSRYFHFRGPNSTVVTACAAGGNALGIGADFIREGRATAMLVGGVDPFSMISFSGFTVLRSLSPNVTKPFNEYRDGLTLGEAAAFLIFEEMEAAIERDAPIYAEFLGYGISNDAYHITSPDPNGGGALRSMSAALKEANVAAQDVAYINAHGTGTPYNDKMETKAIKDLLAERQTNVSISSSKSQLGHTLGTAGAIEAIVCTLAIKHRFYPATIHFENTMDHDLDFVPNETKEGEIQYALSNSFAFGGNTASIVIGKVDGP